MFYALSKQIKRLKIRKNVHKKITFKMADEFVIIDLL